jgi:hypothetical protein
VSAGHHIFISSHYLSRRAYDFHAQQVSLNKDFLDLADFYSELFDLFPKKSRQNEKPISEWAHELEEHYNMIRDLMGNKFNNPE